MGIAEYWMVNYLGLGGRRYVGEPKQPTLTVYKWVDGEYQMQQFRRGDRASRMVKALAALAAPLRQEDDSLSRAKSHTNP
jgi:Uma2 family endonuclease